MGKHSSERTKGKEENKNKLLVGILFTIGVGIIIALLVNSNFFKNEETILKEEATKVVNTTFSNLKKLNIEEVKKYVDYELLISSLDGSILSKNNDNKTSNIEEKLFDNIEWSIESISIRGNEARVTTKVTNKDFRDAISKWIEKLIEAKKKKEISTEEGLKMLEETLSKSNIKQKTVEKKVLLKKQDDWKIVVNKNLRDLLFPEIESIIEEISN